MLHVIYEKCIEERAATVIKQTNASKKQAESVGTVYPENGVEEYREMLEKHSPTVFPCRHGHIKRRLNINDVDYRIAIDNLIRQRVGASFVEYEYIETEIDDYRDEKQVSIEQGYDVVCITDLGMSFVEACMAVNLTQKF